MGNSRRIWIWFVMVLGTAGPTVARAEPFDVKLGLWEVTHRTETSGVPPIDTSGLTPEQRARLEAAMKARAGTQTRTRRSCLTKEKLEKELFPTDEKNASCEHTVVSSTPTVREEKMACTGEQPITGDIRFEALSRERVKGEARMAVGEGSRSMTVHSTMTARWLGSDCGNVK